MDDQPQQPASSAPDGLWARSWQAVKTLRNDTSARTRRIVLLLLLIWIASIFDLMFTVLAHSTGGFVEGNRLMRLLLNNTPGLVCVKFGLLFFASAVLLALRRLRSVEITCWIMAVIFVALAIIWVIYYSQPGVQ